MVLHISQMNEAPSRRPAITHNLTRQEAAWFVVATTTVYVDVIWCPLPDEDSFISNRTILPTIGQVIESFGCYNAREHPLLHEEVVICVVR